MKKIIFSLFMFLCMNAFAAQNVSIVWPFSPASNQANALRAIIDNANKAQDKYNFIFDNKPGAGGSIAVNHVINSPSLTLLMGTTSTLVRPVYYPDQSYDINKLQPVAILSTGSPFVILSKDSNSFDDFKKKSVIKIGIIQGSITETIAKSLQQTVKSEVILVPYNTTINATQDMLGGHIDASVELIKDSMPWVESNKAHILGVTGNKQVDKYKTFSSQGMKNTENYVNNFYLLANSTVDSIAIGELYDIITSAMLKDNVKEIWKLDYAVTQKRTLDETIIYWNTQKQHWKSNK